MEQFKNWILELLKAVKRATSMDSAFFLNLVNYKKGCTINKVVITIFIRNYLYSKYSVHPLRSSSIFTPPHPRGNLVYILF